MHGTSLGGGEIASNVQCSMLGILAAPWVAGPVSVHGSTSSESPPAAGKSKRRGGGSQISDGGDRHGGGGSGEQGGEATAPSGAQR